MKYALINNGSPIEFKNFTETPPVLSANKGRWLIVIEEPYPELSQNHVAELFQFESDNLWFMSWQIRTKTAIELWDHPEFAKRIVAPKNLIFEQIGLAMKSWFDLNGLPVKLNGEQVYLYCNVILPEHEAIVSSYGEILTIEERPENG